MTPLTVSMLAKQTGIHADAVRYYERVGLLPLAARSPAGYRQYDQATADRLHFIKGAQRFGLRLREIAELLAVRDRGACPCGHAEALVRRRIAEIDTEIARLAGLREELTRLTVDFAASRSDLDGSWPCEVQFIHAATNHSEETAKEVTSR
jgi:DNA-binding transcriptional MerR regulator